MTALVIGYGNPLRSDDGLGQAVIDRLPSTLDTLTCHQLTPDLAPRLAAYQRVILVDARDGTPTGRIYTERVTPTTQFPVVVHHLTPALLLTVAQSLYAAYPHMLLTGLTTTHFAVGAQFSPGVQAQLPALVRHVIKLAS